MHMYDLSNYCRYFKYPLSLLVPPELAVLVFCSSTLVTSGQVLRASLHVHIMYHSCV